MERQALDLDQYDTGGFARGRPLWIEALWWVIQAALVRSWIPGTAHRRYLLRVFGAQIGEGVIIKPGLRVKFPWRLQIGNHTWIGEDVWIDNLAHVEIGSHCCISQGAYLCTGSHDWSSRRFDLIVKPIAIENHAWVCAKSLVAPGVTIREGAVLSLGSVATGDLDSWGLYGGVPAKWIKARLIENHEPEQQASRAKNYHGHNYIGPDTAIITQKL